MSAVCEARIYSIKISTAVHGKLEELQAPKQLCGAFYKMFLHQCGDYCH